MIIDGKQLLAELHGDAARDWQAFADVNHVSVDSLLTALGPILREAQGQNVGLDALLRQAVVAAT